MRKLARSAAWLGLIPVGVAHAQSFSVDDVATIQRYWAQPDRYEIDVPPKAMQVGLWQVRQTVEGSQWFAAYNRARGMTKSSSATSPKITKEAQASWDRFLDAKFASDKALAQADADHRNAQILPQWKANGDAASAPIEPIPADLLALAGNPPKFFEATIPLQYTIKFDDAPPIVYVDHIALRPRNPSFRFAQGVMAVGKALKSWSTADLDAIFAEAGADGSVRKIMSAVSALEGGFESVNTYDTGFVSIGMIQFASLKEGGGSLGRMLARHKAAHPDDFDHCFKRFGIDVNGDAKLVALDLETGAQLVGPEANLKIIEDKRLIAAFQRAGQVCRSFQVAQLRSTLLDYFPAEDALSATFAGQPTTFKVSDIIRSEAGMATLMDRKVNTGTLDPLPFVINVIVAQNGVASVADLAKFERDIVVGCKFRRDFLQDTTLTQPGPSKRASATRKAARKGTD